MNIRNLGSSLSKTNALGRVAIFLVVVTIVTASVMAQPAVSESTERITVEVGKTECKTLKKPVNPSVQKASRQPTISRGSFIPANERFCVEGLSVGSTRVTFTGSYRRADNSGGSNNGMIGGLEGNVERFKYILEVTVVAPVPVDDSNLFNVQVEEGKFKDIGIADLLGQDFANASDNGVKWREIVLLQTDFELSRGDVFSSNPGRVRVTGIKAGKTRLTLKGERLTNGESRIVTRILDVNVTKGNPEPVDDWLESMRKYLVDLKLRAAQTGDDETKIDRTIKNFGIFDNRMRTAILNESNRETPRPLREARLKNLRDEASREAFALHQKFDRLKEQVRTIGWHTYLYDLNIVLGARPARRTFRCPPNSAGTYGYVWGTDRYMINSALCAAAVHDNALTNDGGEITVEFHLGSKGDKYLGSKRNGIGSLSDESDWGWFVFVLED